MKRHSISGTVEEDDSIEVLWKDNERFFCRILSHESNGERYGFMAAPSTAEHPSLEGINRLKHEHGLKDYLDSAWALRPLELIHERGRIMLIVDYPGGERLDRLIGPPMEMGLFLRLAVALSTTISRLHGRGLIHKDLKPANVLVNPATNQVWLTGFGMASRFPRERQLPHPPEFITGTLAYMAPEQTGRMNRSIDSRSDLYSLGVTLYEMLTGSLPFTAADPMEWVHCHIARQPASPGERLENIPSMVSAIIMKLLAKTAEERYQSAVGVESDLRRCLSEWEAQGRIGDLALGEHDVPNRLMIPEKLYGRDREVDILLTAFDRIVAGGKPELVLVSGYSGIGKSAVVNELHKRLVSPRGLFASGKFDQYKRDIPYVTLAQAFQSLIRPLLSKNEKELRKWRDALHEALNPNGLLIVELVPELKHIIGEQPPVPELAPQDAQSRFQLIFRRFISVFARPEHPLALFLDDLQWLDAATLDLLEDLLTQESISHVLFIGAYRDNEVDASHPLMRKLGSIKAAGTSCVEEITLGALDAQHVSQLTADALHCETDRVGDLAHLILQKTDGNPFFINQFLSTLTDEGLIAFDSEHSRWSWDLKRIHAKGYTDNVADLMIGKLIRLPAATQRALQQLGCLGNIATTAMLAIVCDTTEQELYASLVEARRQELVDFLESSYRFVHDRVHEAAYALIPTERRAASHLRIGRMLVAHTPPDKLDEAIFDIVNQLNRASSLVTAPEEREQLAEFNLHAGKRAQASSAYVSALNYLTTGAALLTEDSWQQRRELSFALELARAHCEFASGKITEAEERLRSLSIRAVTTRERVAVACLQVDLYQGIDRSDEAVAVGLRALRHLGVDLPERPTEADARRAYDGIRTRLGARAIEDLVNLPLMSDPDSLAALDLLIRVAVPGHFVSFHLFEVAVCTAVSLGLERGHSDASCIAYVQLGTLAGSHFGQFDAGYRFGRLGCELVERPGLQRFQARAFETFGFLVPWTQHVRKGREFLFRGFDLAIRTGEISYAGYAYGQLNTNFLMAGDPLIEAQEQAERGLAFARKVGFGAIEAWILGQLGLIRSLRGLTARLGAFDDSVFCESDLERNLAGNPALGLPECWYYIRKLQARFLAGEYVDALRAASKAQPMLRHSVSLLEVVEYHFYNALCHAAVHDSASPEKREHHRATLIGHLEKLDTWRIHCPENFANRVALVGAEVARIEGRDVDAMRLFEQAIRSAREHGFVQNEGVAHEVAARFYAARGFETVADAYLRNARHCYLRWGADGKVQQLDRLYPHLAAPEGQRPAAIIGSPVQHLDVASVVKASQALSSEIVFPKLIERLMKIAIENAGADRGLLILPSGDEYLIQSEARAAGDQIEVTMRQEPITRIVCPESLVRYVIRTQESVILDDASRPNLFSGDDYLRDRQSKSILCLPLIKQRELTGILLLENSLTSHAFTPARLAVLELLAAQAAISLENTHLYSDLQERESKIRRLVEANVVGIVIFTLEGAIIGANEAFLQVVQYTREDLTAGRVRWKDLTPLEWRGHDERAVADLKSTGIFQPFEKEYFRKDGSRVPILIGGALFDGARTEGVAFVLDLSESKRAESELRQARSDLAHVSRVTTLGEFTASIAHEVNQPLTAVVNNAGACLSLLPDSDPNLKEVRSALAEIIEDADRASAVIARIRQLARKAPPDKALLDMKKVVTDVLALARYEITTRRVTIINEFSELLSPVFGDRVQLQQVLLNLIVNGMDAMNTIEESERVLNISARSELRDGMPTCLLRVQDTGIGLKPHEMDKLFEAFHTTKPEGMGMGLAISRSIIEAHGGKLWAESNRGGGATFLFSLPAARNAIS